jgi:hypothetical protein
MGGLRQFNAKESADKAVHELYEKVWPKGGKMLVTDYIDLATMNGLISKKQYAGNNPKSVSRLGSKGRNCQRGRHQKRGGNFAYRYISFE